MSELKSKGNTASKYRLMDIMAFIIHQLALCGSTHCIKSPGQKYNKFPLVKIFKITKMKYHSLTIALLTIGGKRKSETTPK